MKMYVVSVSLRKMDGMSTVISLAQGYRGAENEDEALGSFISSVPELKPGFDISQTLVMEIPAEDLAKCLPPAAGG